MAEVTQQQVVDYIKGISVLELSQLVKTLEAELGVSAAAAVPMPANASPIFEPMPLPTRSAVAPTPLSVLEPVTSFPKIRKVRSDLATAALPCRLAARVDVGGEEEVVPQSQVVHVERRHAGERVAEVREVRVDVRLGIVEPR